jgi:hypothetical protein
MSVFHGPQKKGAKRIHKSVLRDEAEARNALTKPEDRRKARKEAAK